MCSRPSPARSRKRSVKSSPRSAPPASATVVVPTEKVVEIKDGKKRTITRRICPGYVIVRMALYSDDAHKHINQELWELILNIPGVTGFAGCKRGTAQKPRPITDAQAQSQFPGRRDRSCQ